MGERHGRGTQAGKGVSINMPRSREEHMPAACCDLRGTMGTLRCQVLAEMRRMAGLLTARREEAGRGSCAMQVMFVLWLEFALSMSDATAPTGVSRGLAFRTT